MLAPAQQGRSPLTTPMSALLVTRSVLLAILPALTVLHAPYQELIKPIFITCSAYQHALTVLFPHLIPTIVQHAIQSASYAILPVLIAPPALSQVQIKRTSITLPALFPVLVEPFQLKPQTYVRAAMANAVFALALQPASVVLVHQETS